MSETLQLGQHPDADQLSAFAEQALPPHERERTLAHLAVCADCREIVALSLPPIDESPIESPIAAPIATPGPKVRPWFGGWFSGWRLVWIAAPALAGLVVLTIQLRRGRSGPPRAEGSAQVAVLHPPVPQAPLPPKSEPSATKAATAAIGPRVAERALPVPPRAPSGGEALPVNGRDFALRKVPPLPAQSIGGPVAMNGVMGGMASGNGAGLGQGASAPPPRTPAALPSGNGPALNPMGNEDSLANAAAQPPTAAAAARDSVATGAAAFKLAAPSSPAAPAGAHTTLRAGTPGSTLAPLPSGLPILSSAANLHRRLALDAQHTLFSSEDDGRHWKPVSPPWPGRAIAVAMVLPVPPHPAILSAGVGGHFSGFTSSSSKATQSFAKPSMQSSTQLDATGGSLGGTVTDASGAVIPGAVVTVKESRSSDARTAGARTAEARTAKTDAAGRYLFANLAPGSYSIEASAQGFERLSRAGEVAPSQAAVANLTLAVGHASETVSVAAARAQIELQPEAPPVPSTSATAVAAPAPAPAPATPPAPLFVVLTDTGERWTSADGQSWQREAARRD